MEDKKDFLTRIVLKNSNGLKRFAFSLCRNETDSEDLVSETVAKAYQNLHQLKDENKTKQWLFRILNNQFISSYRSKTKYRFQNLPSDNFSTEPFSLFEQLAKSNFADSINPEKKFIKKVTDQKIHEAINELQEEFRIALILCDIEDMSYAEIALIIKVPVVRYAAGYQEQGTCCKKNYGCTHRSWELFMLNG